MWQIHAETTDVKKSFFCFVLYKLLHIFISRSSCVCMCVRDSVCAHTCTRALWVSVCVCVREIERMCSGMHKCVAVGVSKVIIVLYPKYVALQSDNFSMHHHARLIAFVFHSKFFSDATRVLHMGDKKIKQLLNDTEYTLHALSVLLSVFMHRQ